MHSPNSIVGAHIQQKDIKEILLVIALYLTACSHENWIGIIEKTQQQQSRSHPKE